MVPIPTTQTLFMPIFVFFSDSGGASILFHDKNVSGSGFNCHPKISHLLLTV
jgi:hypothetical protein